MTPKEILATEGANFPRPPPMRTPEEQRVGNRYCRLDHLVKNIKEGKDKQRSEGKKDAPRDKADTIYMVQHTVRTLPVMVGNKEHSTTAWMNFMVIRSPSPYNGIIGRPGISAIRAVPSVTPPNWA
ncbi:hypothetical protein Tco_1169609 [Tanacetum coccineum]